MSDLTVQEQVEYDVLRDEYGYTDEGALNAIAGNDDIPLDD
jgi:hypothetical protein